MPLDEAQRWDTPRVCRRAVLGSALPRPTGCCPRSRARSPTSASTSARSENVHLDVEQRPLKSPRAFCAPIEVPGRVMLVIQPIGGPDDWRALFHEAGHTEHFAHISRDLPVEERRLGDNAVTEGWAMLFEHLVDDPAWLTRRLDFPRPDEFAREGATVLLFFVRRYCAKLLYELEFHAADDPTAMAGPLRRAARRRAQDRAEPDATTSPTSTTASTSARTCARGRSRRSCATSCARSSGSTWFARREAGSLLRELWSLGQKPTAEELLKDVTGATLELDAVAERVRETLPRLEGAAGGGRRGRLGRRPRRARSARGSPRRAGGSSRRRARRRTAATTCSPPPRAAPARNQCRNCSPTRSPLLARERGERDDLLRHAALLLERERDRRDRVGERRLRRLDARDLRPPRRRRAGTGRSSSRGSAPRPPAGRSARRAPGSVSAS